MPSASRAQARNSRNRLRTVGRLRPSSCADLRLRQLVHEVEHRDLLRFLRRRREQHAHQLPAIRRFRLLPPLRVHHPQLLPPERLAGAEQVQAVVRGDPQDPGAGRRGGAKLRQRVQHLDEHVLQRVLRLRVVLQEIAAAAVDRRRVLLVQLGEEPRGRGRAGPGNFAGPAARHHAESRNAHGADLPEKAAGLYAHWVSLPASGPPKGDTTIFRLEEKYVTVKGAALQHSESETSYPLPAPPRRRDRGRRSSSASGPRSYPRVVVLCRAKSRSPPPALSLA